MNLGGWLRRTPQPAIIVADGQRIEVGNRGGKWRDLVRTIESLGANKIEALDRAGNVIRAVTLEDEDVERASKDASKEESELQTFARLLADAYASGSKAQHPILEQSLIFIDRQAKTIADQQREIERLRLGNAKLQAENIALQGAHVDGEGTDSLVSALVQGAAAAALNGGNGAIPVPVPPKQQKAKQQ